MVPLSLRSHGGTSFIRALPFTFYLGLLPVVFIFWAWADSAKQVTSWDSGQIYDPTRRIWCSDSAITFAHTTSRPSADPFRPLLSDQWYWRPVPPLLEGRFGRIIRFDNTYAEPSLFPPLKSLTEAHESAFRATDLTVRTWVVPFWLILAIYLPLWLGLVLVHARRCRRKLSSHATS